MDEIEEVGTVETVGERLKAAREAKGMSIEDIAAATRIPTRHLESLETSDWDKLPAPTYSMGFAKNYAAAVGLDRAEIADQLRGEMGGLRPATYATTEVFEPIDPKRVMPKGLVLGALGALLLLALLLSWLSNRETSDDNAAPVAEAPAAAAQAPGVIQPATAGPVVVTANDTAWVDIRDGATILKQGELASGQSFEVPATAVAPTLTTAKPEALRISVGTADAPAIGPAATKVTVSLKPDDLMKGPQVAPPAPAAIAPAPAPPRPKPAATKPVRRTAPAATTTAPATTAPPPAPAPTATSNSATP